MSREATLPTLADGQSWCCGNGCGECKPKEMLFEYSREEDMAGNLIESKTEKVQVSNCCRAELLLWDECKQNFVDWWYQEDEPVKGYVSVNASPQAETGNPASPKGEIEN